MSLVRWRNRNELAPWRALREIDEQFDRVMGNLASDTGRVPQMWTPAVDLRETEDAYVIEADMPGMKKDDLDINVHGDFVTVKGERKSEHESKEADYHYVERSYGSFQRTFELPGGVDASKADAKFKDGVLKVTLPKREDAKPRQIEVKVNE